MHEPRMHEPRMHEPRMHELLERQIERYLDGDRSRLPAELLREIDRTYKRSVIVADSEAPLDLDPRVALQAVLEATADGIVVVSRDGSVSSCNQQFLDMWGLDASDMEGKAEAGLAAARRQVDDPEAFLAKLRQLDGDLETEDRDLLELRDGRVFERVSKPQRVDGECVGRVWSFRDVSAHRRLEAQVRQAQKMEAVGRVAGGVAHDFNNLLTVIKGYCDLCQRQIEEDEGPLARSLRQIAKAAERAADMTSQLLAFSRQQKLEPRVVDLDAITLDFQPMLRRLIAEDVALTLRLGAETATVLADPGRLQQVLLNLVINARDAMPGGGSIHISTESIYLVPGAGNPFGDDLPAGDYVLMQVADDGEGMAPEVRNQIFEPFFTTKDKGRGTGLGLATVYGIVRQSGGAITVESSPGVGTVFSLALPVALASDYPVVIRDPILEPPAARARILVVEDEEPVRLMLEALLLEQGHQVFLAASPEQALREFGSPEPELDLMVTDIVMPGMYGPELADRLRTVRPELRVLYISGYDPAARERRGAPRAGGAFLQKPFDAATLERKIQEVLRSEAGAPVRDVP